MIINSISQKSKRSRKDNSHWLIWHESYFDSYPSDNEPTLTQILIDEADLSDYIDSMTKSNISLVSLQRIRDIPALF